MSEEIISKEKLEERYKKVFGIMFAFGYCHEWDEFNTLQKKWQRVADKCIKKAEEYK